MGHAIAQRIRPGCARSTSQRPAGKGFVHTRSVPHGCHRAGNEPPGGVAQRWQSVPECHLLVQQRQGSTQRDIYDRSVDTSLPIVGRRVAKVSFAYVVPYLSLDLPAWTAGGESEWPDYVLQIDGGLRFTDSGAEHEVSQKASRTQYVCGCYGRLSRVRLRPMTGSFTWILRTEMS